MIPLRLDLDGVAACRDLRTGHYHIEVLGTRVTAREWTWGERRRLIRATEVGGTLDRVRFVRGLLDLVCDPAPPEELHPVLAHVLLDLFGVLRARAGSLAKVEACLARSCGWTPLQIDGQPAPVLDEMAEELEGGGSRGGEGPPPGWNRIVVTGARG